MLAALKLILENDGDAPSSSCRPVSPGTAAPTDGLDWIEADNDLEDNADSEEESDEDSLCNKLCTFTQVN